MMGPSAERPSVEAGLERWLAWARPLDTESVPAARALGRVLAQGVVASRPLPAYTRSAVDGYALRCADLAAAASGVPVSPEAVLAGRPASPLQAFAAMYVATGAMVPAGADAVVPIELAHLSAEPGAGAQTLRVDRPVQPGANIQVAGEDLPADELALSEGIRIHADNLPLLLAATGGGEVRVRRRPRVRIIPTGDEIASAAERPSGARVVEVIGPSLMAHAAADGADVRLDAPLPDDRERLQDALRQAAQTADIVVTLGGASVGRRDHAARALALAGGAICFHGLRLRPGTPVLAGSLLQSLVLGLPGNPVAALTAWELLGRPLLARLLGTPAAEPQTALLAASSVKRPVRDDRYLRGSVWQDDSVLRAAVFPGQNAGKLVPLARTNALVLHPAGVARLEERSAVRVILTAPLLAAAPAWVGSPDAEAGAVVATAVGP